MGGGRVWGHVAGVWIRNRGSGLVHGRRDVAGVGTCGREWRHVAGCGDMWHGWWQGVGACGRGLDTSTPRALVECSSYVQTAMCKLLCANCYVQTGHANWSVWRHVTRCGDMWHGWWQGVGACGRGLDT